MVLSSGEAVGAATRLPAWRDLIRENFVALDIDADAHDGFAGRVRSSVMGHLQVSDVRSTTQGCTRTGELARRDAVPYLQVGLLTEGEAVLRQDDRECLLRPGDFALYETDRPFFWGLRGNWQLLVYTWPRSTLALHDGESRAMTARTLAGSQGLSRIVGRTLRELVTDTPDVSPAGGVRLADEMGELVATTAMECSTAPGPTGPTVPTGPQAALLHEIDRYIVEHLADPALDPAAVAAAHFISTRQLHRLFAAQGRTVSRTIRRYRLQRCRRELAGPASAGTSITEVARRWGFSDPAGFSRSFRAAYGISPSAHRNRAAPLR